MRVRADQPATARGGAGAKVFDIGAALDRQAGGVALRAFADDAFDIQALPPGLADHATLTQAAGGLQHLPARDVAQPFLCDVHFPSGFPFALC